MVRKHGGLGRAQRLECVSRLKSALPQTQLMMLSLYGDANPIDDALAAGARNWWPPSGICTPAARR